MADEKRPSGWHRRPGSRPIPETPTHLPNGEPVNLQPDIDAQLQYWCDLYGADPYGFALNMFEWGKPYSFLANRERPYDFQCEILEDMTKSLAHDPSIYRLGVAAGKGIGKSALLAMLFLWHVTTHRYSRSNLLGVTGDSLDQRMWSEIGQWFDVCKARPYFKRYRGGRIVHIYHDTWYGAYQLWQVNRVEALFGSHAPYLGYFLDEVCGIPDEVLEAIESGMTDEHVIAVYISNPTRLRSRFRQCFDNGALSHLWHTWQIDNRTTERHNAARVQELLDEANGDENASRFRINVRGLFPLQDYDQVIPSWILEQACERTSVSGNSAAIIIGVDVARKGQNKTVFCVRQGDRLLEMLSYEMQETDITADRLMELIDRYKQRYEGVVYGVTVSTYIDADGLGVGVLDICRRAGYEVHAVDSGKRAIRNERYTNRKAEIWYRLREWLRTEGCLPKSDTALLDQLQDVYYFHDKLGRLTIESKEELLARGIASPDRADALVYTFAGERRRIQELVMHI